MDVEWSLVMSCKFDVGRKEELEKALNELKGKEKFQKVVIRHYFTEEHLNLSIKPDQEDEAEIMGMY